MLTMDYSPLASRSLSKGATFHQPRQTLPERVSLDSPAVDVMTDLQKVTAITIAPTRTVDAAKQRMIKRAVRLLLVVDEQNTILGLLTSSDILGEKPMQFIQKHGGRREDILVRDIMTPHEKLEVLCMADVKAAKVGGVVATLKKSGRQHALVVDKAGPDESQVVRGIFSTSRIARQLGTEISTTEIAQTFAEIQLELAK